MFVLLGGSSTPIDGLTGALALMAVIWGSGYGGWDSEAVIWGSTDGMTEENAAFADLSP